MSVLLPSSCLYFLLSVGFHAQRCWGCVGLGLKLGVTHLQDYPRDFSRNPLMAAPDLWHPELRPYPGLPGQGGCE